MNYYKIILISFFILLIPFSLYNQSKESPGDKYTILTMPFNKRPLNNYRGQFQINTGYNFSVRSRSYDMNGDKTVLKDIGTAFVSHYYYLEVKYGITNFLEAGMETSYVKSGTRSQSEVYFSSNAAGSADQISAYYLDETKGFTDLLFSGSLRLPFEYKWFDFRICGGYYIPTAKHEPPKPSNTITDATSLNTYTINYHNNYRNGFGVPVVMINTALKATISRFTFMTSYTLCDPVREGNSIRWEQSLVNKNFTYYSKPYTYLLSRTTKFDAAIHYQAAGWFDINLNFDFFHSSSGWTEYWGNKYKNPEQKLFTLEPGFEIQVSPLVRIYEVVGFPVSGENTYAPFYIFTTFRFNFFAFRKF